MENNAAEMGGEGASWWDLMGLSETVVPNGYLNGENDWKWWLPSGNQKPDMKSIEIPLF
jgi:hypothetical protein